MRPGRGLPVVVTAGLQQGSRTQAWCYDAAAVSSAGGATNGPSSGSTSATVAGLGFGSWGCSGRARVGRGAVSDTDMTGGTACEASTWRSSSGVECRLSAGGRGGLAHAAGTGAACCCDGWAAAREPNAGVVLRCCGCEQRGRGDQRAVVGMHVGHCCRLGLRQLGLQRAGAGGPGSGWCDGHDGGDCVRGVEVEVEQRGGVQAEFRCCWGLRTLGSVSRAACCCDVWAAAREPDAGVVL